MKGRIKLFIVRHGESTANANNIMQGRGDYKLSRNGKRQANILAKLLQEEKINLIYTSPLKRAYQTAKIISKNIHVQLIVDSDLVERDIGIFTHCNLYEVKIKNPDLFIQFEKYGFNVVPQAESDEKIKERARMTMNKLGSLPSGNYIIISHGIFISNLINEFLQKTIYKKYQINNTAITTLEIINGKLANININSSVHNSL